MVTAMQKGRALLVAAVVIGALGWSVWLMAQPTLLERSGTALVWEECEPAQVEVMILGTIHFAQQGVIDVLAPERQTELEALAAALETFGPTKAGSTSPDPQADPGPDAPALRRGRVPYVRAARSRAQEH